MEVGVTDRVFCSCEDVIKRYKAACAFNAITELGHCVVNVGLLLGDRDRGIKRYF